MKKHITTFYRLTEEERRALIPSGAVSEEVPVPPVSVPDSGERLRISPRAAVLAAEYGISPAEAVPSGPHGRVIERDILVIIRASGRMVQRTPDAGEASAEVPPVPENVPEPEPERGYAVGETVTFGSLDGHPLKWLVAESTPDEALIVCLECVNEMAYLDNHWKQWSESTIMKWLNGYFAQSSFLPEERERICGGQIFILKESEVRTLLQRFSDSFEWNGPWWVRPEREPEKTFFGWHREYPRTMVSPADAAAQDGFRCVSAGVRPALRLR